MRNEIAGICQKVRTVRNGWCEASASEAADEILSLIREKVPTEDDLFRLFWRKLCNSCDCENYPECPEGTEGCIADTLAKGIRAAILKELDASS